VLDEEEGIAIASALGEKKAAVLQNHGLLTCAKSVEATVYWFISLERRSRTAAGDAAGGRGGARVGETVKIHDECGVYYQSTGSELAGWFSAKPAFDSMPERRVLGHRL